MSVTMYYVTWGFLLFVIGLFGWASIFRADFRKDVFGGKQGEATVLGLVTVKGAAIILLFALLLGGILQVFNLVERTDQRQFDSNVLALRSSLDAHAAALVAAEKTIGSLRAETKRLVFRPIDETEPPYCDLAGSPEPKAVPFHDSLGRPNLALLAQARASASSLIPWTDVIGARHRSSYINDGWYNNCRSWIAGKTPAWIAIDLGDVYQVTGVAFGSEHDIFYKDRSPLRFRVEVALNNTDWKLAYEQRADIPVSTTTVFNFSKSMSARVVRVTILASAPPNYPDVPGTVRMDELEILVSQKTRVRAI